MRTVKAFATETYEMNKFGEKNDEVKEKAIGIAYISAIVEFLTNLLF